MTDQVWLWVGFNVFVLGMLALDPGVFRRQARVVTFKESMNWPAALALNTAAAR